MSKFYEIEPSLENYWRAIILFGRNVASYKFALAKALYDLKNESREIITLDKLAVPFTKHILEHLTICDKQGTPASSLFLEACRDFNSQRITYNNLIDLTVRLGFNNVIDAFHNVHNQELPKRFFIDERKTKGGIALTDNFHQLSEKFQYGNLIEETESRWRLVETAWKLNLPKHLVQIDYSGETHELIADNKLHRVTVTSARPSLNGYQKGRCFYCFREISIDQNCVDFCDVDHFFPHNLRKHNPEKPLNGVANLVLACTDCNRGINGKFAQLPSIPLLERLHNRNEYLIASHHPLRETLIAQTGNSIEKRQQFLQNAYNCAITNYGMTQKWQPIKQGVATF